MYENDLDYVLHWLTKCKSILIQIESTVHSVYAYDNDETRQYTTEGAFIKD